MLGFRLLLSAIFISVAVPASAEEVMVSSDGYRSSKNTLILGEYGSAVVPIMTQGFSLGTVANSRTTFEFGYAQGMRDVKYAELYAKFYSIKMKNYWYGSFYTNTGFAYRDVMDRTTNDVSEDFYVQRKGKSAGVDFSIGNRWSVGNVSIGCDWVGFFHPLHAARTESFIITNPQFMARQRGGDPNASRSGGSTAHTLAEAPGSGHRHGGPSSFDRHQNDWDRLSKHGTWQLLRLSLGVLF